MEKYGGGYGAGGGSSFGAPQVAERIIQYNMI